MPAAWCTPGVRTSFPVHVAEVDHPFIGILLAELSLLGPPRYAKQRQLAATLLCALLVVHIHYPFLGMSAAELCLLSFPGTCTPNDRTLLHPLLYALLGVVVEVGHSLLGMPTAELSLLTSRYARARMLGTTRVCALLVVEIESIRSLACSLQNSRFLVPATLDDRYTWEPRLKHFAL